MTVTAIIPARGGSKGIRRKNLVTVCGKPLIVWTIEHALAAESVDEVIVSTDCSEIGRVAMEHGAEWFMRGDDTATDDAPSESVLVEFLETIKYEPELIVFLQATSPIRQPGDIDGAVQRLRESGAESLFSARHIEGYTWTAGSAVTPNYQHRDRRQVQCLRRLEENGSIYVFKPEILRKYKNRLGGKIDYYEMHPLDSFQVDEPRDIETIEAIMPQRIIEAVA